MLEVVFLWTQTSIMTNFSQMKTVTLMSRKKQHNDMSKAVAAFITRVLRVINYCGIIKHKLNASY